MLSVIISYILYLGRERNQSVFLDVKYTKEKRAKEFARFSDTNGVGAPQSAAKAKILNSFLFLISAKQLRYGKVCKGKVLFVKENCIQYLPNKQ